MSARDRAIQADIEAAESTLVHYERKYRQHLDVCQNCGPDGLCAMGRLCDDAWTAAKREHRALLGPRSA